MGLAVRGDHTMAGRATPYLSGLSWVADQLYLDSRPANFRPCLVFRRTTLYLRSPSFGHNFSMGCAQSGEQGSKEDRVIAAQIDAELRADARRKAPELRILLLGTKPLYALILLYTTNTDARNRILRFKFFRTVLWF